jgi:hypothetical protein
MKLLFAFSLSLLSIAWTCNALAATASGSFNFDFASEPPCSATVTADCIDHFEVWDVTATAKKLATVPVPNPPAAAVNFSFKVGPPYGPRKWAAVAVAKDGTSSDMSAPQAQAAVTVRPGAPASFVVNLQ